MKRFWFACAFWIAILKVASSANAQQKIAPEFPLKIHVTRSFHPVLDKNIDIDIDAIIEGRKYQLECQWASKLHYALLLPGDYDGRLSKDDKKLPYTTDAEYEMRMPDGKTVKWRVISISE